jgi:prevent-host-death family protein
MTRQVNLYEAKTNLSQLVEDAANGEEIIIAKNGKPMAKLTVVTPAEEPKKRKLGQWAHLMTPEERAYYDSEQFLRDWKAMDAEIERDFEESINRPLEEPAREFKWDDTSSTPAPSSARKKTPRRSARRRAKR